MVESQWDHSVDARAYARVECWVGYPMRGPCSTAWTRLPMEYRRELVWAMGTQLADLETLRTSGEVHVSLLPYVSTRLSREHPAAWDRMQTEYGPEAPGLERKLYRLANALSGVVTTEVPSATSDGPRMSSPNV